VLGLRLVIIYLKIDMLKIGVLKIYVVYQEKPMHVNQKKQMEDKNNIRSGTLIEYLNIYE